MIGRRETNDAVCGRFRRRSSLYPPHDRPDVAPVRNGLRRHGRDARCPGHAGIDGSHRRTIEPPRQSQRQEKIQQLRVPVRVKGDVVTRPSRSSNGSRRHIWNALDTTLTMRRVGRGRIRSNSVVSANGPAKLSASVASNPSESLQPIGESSTADVVDQHVHVTDPPDHVLGNEEVVANRECVRKDQIDSRRDQRRSFSCDTACSSSLHIAASDARRACRRARARLPYGIRSHRSRR